MAAQTALEETTLDEPVSETLNRELRAIANKMHKVVVYSSDSKAELRNWDLWGPLVLCLVPVSYTHLTLPTILRV